MSNFLPIPTKRAEPLPAFSGHILTYISHHFRDAHPEAFRKDVDVLATMRRELVEPKAEAHPEMTKGLMRYYAQLSFLATKFPSDIGLSFAYHLPFPPIFSLTAESTVSLPSLTYERASVLFNVAALYSIMAASERRAEVEGIRRALGYLSAAAGIFHHLIQSILPILRTEIGSPHAAGYDMTESFLTTLREFLLAEAQECFWQQAVLQGTYKNSLIGKLSMKVSEYYGSALSAANAVEYPSAAYFPVGWLSHITVKQMHFEAAAQYRLSQDDLESRRYGHEITRLRIAEGLAKKGLEASKKGVADAVLSDLKNLSAAVKSNLERADRDNNLIYNDPIPPANQLPALKGTSMVKLSTPPEVSDPVAWLMNNNAGMPPLFSGLVPYGVHLALSIYDDRKDTVVRDLDGKREELDGLAASTLQSLNLPGSIEALERPIGLPPSLMKKAEEVEAAGGTDKIRSLLGEVSRLAKTNAKLLSEAMDILDQEATENEHLLTSQPHLISSRQPSHEANQRLIGMADQYEKTLKQAAVSDATVVSKWEEFSEVIEVLAGGEEELRSYIPSTARSSSSSLPTSVRPLRASLEELDDRMSNRARIVAEAKHIASGDDVRAAVLTEATRLAHGGSGDVKTEWFEDIFERNLGKYDKFKDEMEKEAAFQEALLGRIREQNEAFLAERKQDPMIKDRERALQEIDGAYWKWREIVDNAQEGIKFYNSLSDMLHAFKGSCGQFLNSRRADVGAITTQFQNTHIDSLPRTTASQPLPPPPPKQVTFALSHPNSGQWTSGADLLPPPPPQPILRSGGVPQAAQSVDSPRRMTRSQAAAAVSCMQPKTESPPIGDRGANPYKRGGRRGGEGVI
ncbi:hypothetical protein TREMEDRAFT_63488 [Tremella mesenterica DSM 1558]|uniref:uncharacterized protein n=1 Tax=Tremella mesenterica (strain ATCC 24925 / CBS 8224 / DSM 1558 / NBRC 9311 / NRRL Y-6157 / RJB 2259-6 / UBC 559-6) TaxID=578456 RepID=UPI0003F49886|nr:uncharacterized protein TREMEDRAFT_63488 [Tremella mesenterica DSM 1558]EIW68315.1 hypothetical protein TREMEDRAFT_63488 [Tremella mesenterica DSM 1558]